MSSNDFSVIRPAAIADTGAFTRASLAWYFDKTATRQQAGVNVPRFTYDPATATPLGALIELAATNLVQNNTLVGLVAGTIGAGGALPTRWIAGVNGSGLSVAVSQVTENGIPCAAVRFFGNAGAATEAYIAFEPNNPPGIAAVAGDLVDLSVYARLSATPNVANVTGAVLRLQPVTNAGAVTGAALDSASILASLTSATSVAKHRPEIATQIPTSASYTGTTGVWPLLAFQHLAGNIDFTVLIGLPQVEKGVAAASSAINTTNGGAVTRAADTNGLKLLSSIPEPATGDSPDPAAWAAGTAYVTGNQVHRTTTHKIYQRINAAAATTDATLPETDAALASPTKWIEVGSTNKWRALDQANESQSSNADDLVMVLAPGQVCDSLAVLNIQGTSVRCVVLGTTYDQTQELATRSVDDWLEYFTEPFDYRSDAVFVGLPLGASRQIMLIVKNTGGVAKVGNVVAGLSKALGGTRFGASAGIIDYSQKVTNAFGLTTVTKRSFSKRMNVAIWMKNTKVDEAQRMLADLRATPLVWVGAGNLYGALIVYGFFRSFEIVISDPLNSLCNMEIEGLA